MNDDILTFGDGYFGTTYESTQDRRKKNALLTSKFKNKKGKKRHNWENPCTTIWQGKKRY